MRILITGYPKSGNTWACRLIAEAAGCPFNAFLEDGELRGLWEVGAEGLERPSDFCVVKSHHSIEEITNYCQSNDKVIYVLRNPKDVLASALNYPWPESRLREFAKKKETYALWEYLIREIVALIFWALRFFAPDNSLHLRLLGSILFGNFHGHKWLEKSWGEHLNGIENSDAFVLKYEDLKRAPIETCVRVMDYLELDISQIKRSVDNQSFEKKKSGFLKNGETEKADFLSTGKIGGGDHMSKKIERWLLEKRFRAELSKFMYH